jgi:hypothetical protein
LKQPTPLTPVPILLRASKLLETKAISSIVQGSQSVLWSLLKYLFKISLKPQLRTRFRISSSAKDFSKGYTDGTPIGR